MTSCFMRILLLVIGVNVSIDFFYEFTKKNTFFCFFKSNINIF